MPNYQNGKIYTIRNHNSDKYYIGSTTDTLSRRKQGHMWNYRWWLKNNKEVKSCSSFIILEDDTAYIELLEKFPCNSKQELEKREGELIREHKENIVNLMNAGLSIEQRKERDHIIYKKYYEENKEAIKERVNNYRLENTDIIRQRKKEYRIQNAEKIKEKQKETYICGCGRELTKAKKSRHEKTQFHQNFITNNT